MRRKIPSTAALIAFEASARHGSFTRAAEELSLTQGAVCRQVAALEAFLGVELFRRTQRGVKLTESGQEYGRRVSAQLDALEQDTLAIAGRQRASVLELAVVPTFATRWLLPRMGRFQQDYPQVTVNLSNRTRPFLFADTDFDAALHFGDADWSGTCSYFLFHEQLLPVCSPRLLGGQEQLTLEQLAELPLLQQSTRPHAWQQWFDSLGALPPQNMRGARYELFFMLAQAAIQDMGVALIPPMLIQRELDQGELVPAIPHAYVSRNAYYLVVPERRIESVVLSPFREWLLTEARDYRHTLNRESQGQITTDNRSKKMKLS